MLLLQFFTPKIAHSSYILAGHNTCAVIDPRRDVQLYIDAAKSQGVKITHIIETHLHADFVSGHLDLAQKTGATIYAPDMGHCAFEHVAVSEGDEVVIEDMVLQVLETPGHTPEHASYVVVDKSRSAEPVGVFCGDTLFVGDTGRPDLFPGRARELAGALYSSLHDKLLRLPDSCEVYPAHAAGSLCGRNIAAKRQSAIGYERRNNPALLIDDKEAFIASLTTDMPPAPDHFGRCSAINCEGPALISSLPSPRAIEPQDFATLAARDDTVIIDTRSYAAFGGQYIAGSFSLNLQANFPTFAGWVVPSDKDILLVTSSGAEVAEAVEWLRRVGMDRTIGFLAGGTPASASAGLPLKHIPQLCSSELRGIVLKGASVLVDVRAKSEYETGHIKGAVNIPFADLRTRYSELDSTAVTVVYCSSGVRSSLGASLLARSGFSKLMNVAGGITGYRAAGFPLE
jgi:hydroxyacylglutathione hydrolase